MNQYYINQKMIQIINIKTIENFFKFAENKETSPLQCNDAYETLNLICRAKKMLSKNL